MMRIGNLLQSMAVRIVALVYASAVSAALDVLYVQLKCNISCSNPTRKMKITRKRCDYHNQNLDNFFCVILSIFVWHVLTNHNNNIRLYPVISARVEMTAGKYVIIKT